MEIISIPQSLSEQLKHAFACVQDIMLYYIIVKAYMSLTVHTMACCHLFHALM